jgi:hypothetical protein
MWSSSVEFGAALCFLVLWLADARGRRILDLSSAERFHRRHPAFGLNYAAYEAESIGRHRRHSLGQAFAASLNAPVPFAASSFRSLADDHHPPRSPTTLLPCSKTPASSA